MHICQLTAEQTLAIRHQVLWPNKDPAFCIVEGDQMAAHYGVKLDQQLVCVASIYIDQHSARLRKFATLTEHQGKGVGRFMLNFLLDELKQQGCKQLWFDARESAVGFYQSFGFSCSGERFYKSDVAYFKMSSSL